MSILKLYKYRFLFKLVASYIVLAHVTQLIFPAAAYALTSGPSQPEFSSFTPVGTSEMVDVSSGDFTYNIPLLDVGGYPVNLSYQGGYGMDDEAGSTGLGWNLNIGQLNRQMRGLPDEFDGQKIKREFNMKPNTTIGLKLKVGWEFAGLDIDKLKDLINQGKKSKFPTINAGIFHNNYRGVGFEVGVTPQFTIQSKAGLLSTLGLGFKFGNTTGISLIPTLSKANYAEKVDNEKKSDVKVERSDLADARIGNNSFTLNSRSGLTSLSLDYKTEMQSGDSKLKNGLKYLASRGNTISFASPAFMPYAKFPYTGINASLSATIGLSFAGQHPKLGAEAYFSKQSNAVKELKTSAYGYFHLEKTNTRPGALMDFNREKDGPYFAKATPNLPIPQMTYDLFTATGQGVGGMFRARRNDWGIVGDPTIRNTDLGLGTDLKQIDEDDEDQSFAFEFGSTTGIHFGGNLNFNWSESGDGKWENGNQLDNNFRFRGVDPNHPTYEPFYFKNIGEMTTENDPNFYASIGDDKPVYVHINGAQQAKDEFRFEKKNPDESIDPISINQKTWHRDFTKRARRNQHMSFLTAAEADKVGVDRKMKSYTLLFSNNETGWDQLKNSTPINRLDENRGANDPSEYTVVNPGGMRYVYGIPAYNFKQRDVTFNISHDEEGNGPSDPALNIDCENNLIGYNGDVDNSIDNKRGIDHYFEATELPPFAHSYLLTHVFSPDYVDVGGNGISPDDPGQAYNIRYSRINDAEKPMRWRTPMSESANMANYNKGFETKDHDNKANYVYGEKDYWLPQSIWSKSQVAVFFYSNRSDGLGVLNENGALDGQNRQKKLDEIRLYSRQEIEALETGNLGDLTPIKTVFFKYTNALCPGVPNNDHPGSQASDQGKLTLKYLYFTYRNSEQGAHNKYEFVYAGGDSNPEYASRDQDRWGKYKPNDCSVDGLPTWEYPYTDQRVIDPSHAWYDISDPDKRYTDVYAEAWQLKTIKTPTGAEINITYESDDYAYVQHKKAMQMVKIIGAGPTSTMPVLPDPKDKFYSKSGINFVNHNYLFVELPQSVNSSTPTKEIRDKYIKDIEDLYVNFYTDLNGEGKYEYVGGYVEIAKNDVTGLPDVGLVNGSVTTAWIRLNPARKFLDKSESKTLNYQPIARLAWDYARLNNSELVYPGSDFKNTDDNAFDVLKGFIYDIAKIFGYYRMVRGRGFGQTFNPEKSWIRLHTPDGIKHGGGNRVKKIEFSDRWDEMAGGKEGSYGMEYDYMIRDKDDPTKIIESSGVAAWEPMLGGEENPFRMPAYYRVKNLLNKDDVYTQLEPFGESYFPAPRIVYSYVTVRPIPKKDPNTHEEIVVRHGSGYTVHEFYTAKEYPVYSRFTRLKVKTPVIPKILPFGKNLETYAASQGYGIYLNGMHGTPKSRKEYSQSGKLIGGTEYIYREKDLPKVCPDCKELVNEGLKTIHPDGSISENTTLGKEIDFAVASREQYSFVSSVKYNGNLDIFSIALIPFALLFPFRLGNQQSNRFRSMTTAKVIYRFPILKEVKNYQGSAEISTFNEAWDAETGDVILTRMVNEYNESQYQWNDPAYRAYDRMGPAYQNQGATFADINLDNMTQAQTDVFVKGDEILINDQRAWVLDVQQTKLAVVDKGGQLLPPTLTDANSNPVNYPSVKILRSGRRNLQDASVGTIITKTDPIANANATAPAFSAVLSASASEYRDRWQMFCGNTSFVDKCESCNDASAASQHLMALISSIAQSHGLDGSIVSLDNHPAFTFLLKDAIFGNLPIACDPQIRTTLTNTTNNCSQGLEIRIGENCNQTFTEKCLITLNATDPNNKFCLEFLDQFENITAIVADPNSCDESNDFTVDGYINYCDGTGTPELIPLTGHVSCFPVRECDVKPYAVANCANPGDVINPFRMGIWGNWRTVKSYTFLGGRTVDASNGTTIPTANMATDLSKQGEISNYQNYWVWNAGKLSASTDQTVLDHWQWADETRKIIPQGYPVESKNALGIYSSVIYGYQMELPIAVASNARNIEIANANFEVSGDIGNACFVQNQFGNAAGDAAAISEDFAHTGSKSYKIYYNPTISGYAMVQGELTDAECQATADDLTNGYLVKECDCAGTFKPTRDKTYRMSFWVRSEEFENENNLSDYDNLDVEIKVDGTINIPFENVSRSPIIDGWQQITGTFYIPAAQTGASNSMRIDIINAQSDQALYLDDFRVYPFNSSMESFVYDPGNRRLLAKMDVQGYATFYQYDREGNLTSVKRETAEGIQTLQEGRQHIMRTMP